MLLSRSRAFTVNLGNFEFFRTEATVSDIDTDKLHISMTEANALAENLLDGVLKDDLTKAGEISSVANTYVLTWLAEDK